MRPKRHLIAQNPIYWCSSSKWIVILMKYGTIYVYRIYMFHDVCGKWAIYHWHYPPPQTGGPSAEQRLFNWVKKKKMFNSAQFWSDFRLLSKCSSFWIILCWNNDCNIQTESNWLTIRFKGVTIFPSYLSKRWHLPNVSVILKHRTRDALSYTESYHDHRFSLNTLGCRGDVWKFSINIQWSGSQGSKVN